MEFKDYYATLGVEPKATSDEIKRAYRKLARKYHPDVSKEPQAEARFKEVAEAHEALIDSERRAAYDDIVRRRANGQPFEPPPGWDSGSQHGAHAGDAGDFSDFFESLFGRSRSEQMGRRHGGFRAVPGPDQQAQLVIGLHDAYAGAERRMSLRMRGVDAGGHPTIDERQIDVRIPKGVRPGQRLRLAGQGGAGRGGAPAGDLYLEIQFLPHPLFRVDGGDVHFDLPVAPWEAALGATVTAPTPDGSVELEIPPGSTPGRRLRLKGKGLPGKPAGDLYAVLTIALPPAVSAPERDAYQALARAFAGYDPRVAVEEFARAPPPHPGR